MNIVKKILNLSCAVKGAKQRAADARKCLQLCLVEVNVINGTR